MYLLVVILLSVLAVAVIAVAAVRLSLKKESEGLLQRLSQHMEDGICQYNDIEADLEHGFDGRFITFRDEQEFSKPYVEVYDEAKRTSRRFKLLHMEVPAVIEKFVDDYENLHSLVESHNERFADKELDTYKEFFDTCLSYPLDRQQRRAIVSGEDNCLLVSSAGSGKTSSIVGKVKYLIDIKHIDPRNILLISYTNKAASELTERMGIEGLRGYTFHKLAIDIIGQATGKKPTIYSNTDALFVKIFHELINTEEFRKNVVKYFIDYQAEESESDMEMDERRRQLSEKKDTRYKAQFPDMDGMEIYVRSEQERKICHALTYLGLDFRYEEAYEYPLADGQHTQYRPDFSIYYTEEGQTKRIYLEHFGVDEHSLVPSWFAKDNGMSYEEANQKYNDGMAWKKAAHEKFETRLLVSTSADFYNGDIQDKLKEMLTEAGVPLRERSYAELCQMILPRDSKQEKSFIRLVITFITLLKSSCKSIDEVSRKCKRHFDLRGRFVVEKVFRPVYERYVSELSRLDQIDFTDAILQATEICRLSGVVKYDYIIVDEFQDISVDRYNFLKALREGTPPAKLFCVGDDWQSIYRFSGSDMTLFNQFQDYFGHTDIRKIETTYRFGEPLISLSSQFIQRNWAQIRKEIHSFNPHARTELQFCECDRSSYCRIVEQIVASIPRDKSVFLLGRYSFDDYYLSFRFASVKEGSKFFYTIGGRKIEFLTVHKSKGLEADYVIILQCNKDIYGFPTLISDDPVLAYVLTKRDNYPYSEERRLFYVAITRARAKTFVLYDERNPSVFVEELNPAEFEPSVGFH